MRPLYDYIGDPGGLLRCSVCSEIYLDPVMTGCSHTFCRQCITKWAEESPGGGCPKCRRPLQVTGTALRNDLRLKEEIDRLTVKCNDVLCSWVGKRADHIAHWKAACPVRGTRQGRFTAFYDLSVLESNESGSDAPIMESSMTIVVKTIEGQMMKLQLLRSDSVDRLKVVISERQGIEPAMQRLIFGGKQLEDGKTLRYYGLGPDMTVHLVLRQEGS